MAPGGGGGGRGKKKGTPPPTAGGAVGAAGTRSLASLSGSETATYYTAAREFESSEGSSPVDSPCLPVGGGGDPRDVEAEGEGASGGASPQAPPSRGAPPPSMMEVVVASPAPAPSVVVEAAASSRAQSPTPAASAAVTEPPSRGGWWWSRRPPPPVAASMTDDSLPDNDDDIHAVDGNDIRVVHEDEDDGDDGDGGSDGHGGGGGSAAAPAAAPWVPVRDTPRSSFWGAAFFGRSPPWTSGGSNGGGGGGGVSGSGGSRGWGRGGVSGSRAGGGSGGWLRAAAAAAAAATTGTSPPVSLALSGWEPQSDVPAFGLSSSVALPPPGARSGPVDLGGVAASLASDDAGDEDEEEDESLSVDGGSACATPVAAGRAGWGGDDPGVRPHRGGGAEDRDESSGSGSGCGSGSASPPPSSMRVRKPVRAAKPADLFSLEEDVQAEAAAAAAAEEAEDVHPRRVSMASYETRDTSSLASKPRVKLEVLRASDIKGVHQLLFSSIAFAGLYLLIIIVLCNTVHVNIVPLPNEQGIPEPVRHYVGPLGFQVFEVGVSTVLFVLSSAVFVAFVLRIWRVPRAERTHEQLWVLMLYISTLLYSNPVYEVYALLHPADNLAMVELLETLDPWTKEWAFTTTVFLTYAYFYVWISVHSYRIMRGRLRLLFYAPKILVLTLFGAIRIFLGVYARIYLGYLPFMSFISSLMLLRKGVSRQAWDFSLILLITIYEAGLIVWICYEASLTRKALARTSYMRYRSKQIGFRFFLFHVISSFGSLFLFNVLIIVTFPSEPLRLVKERLSLVFLGVQPGKCASDIILYVFLAQESWVNLPADSYGLRGWLAPPASEPADPPMWLGESRCLSRCCWGGDGGRARPIAVEEMFTYRQREPSPGRHVSPRCLVMDTTVLMFNMAWIAYSYGTPRKRRRQPADYGRHDHVMARYAIGRRTDTHALVVDAPDRIIVAFKGSTNLADLRTDISVFTVDIETVLALPLSGALRTGEGATLTDDAEAGATPEGTGGAGGDGGGDQERASAAAGAAGGLHGDGGDVPPPSNPNPTPTPTSGAAPISSAPSSSAGSRYLRAAMRQASWFSLLLDKLRGRATVHTGFSSAYLSVRREVVESVMALYRERPRPIWLTGHSLGGALATLCSYDLARRVAVPAEEISVVTFGAPRVGNAAFREVYNNLIPRHWRVVLASDVVTKLPKLGYLHVGNQALLTNEAQLFIDPSFVELKWFHWKDTSIRTHRKGNYISAMQEWCRTEHGPLYAPDFWLERGGQKSASAKGARRGGGDGGAKGARGTKAETESSTSVEGGGVRTGETAAPA